MNPKKELKRILLIDDNPDDNYYHQIIIEKFKRDIKIMSMEHALDALTFLKTNEEETDFPDLIFLDINMPRMNGWEFLSAYREFNLDKKLKNTIIVLSTSDNPLDIEKTKTWDFVSEYRSKPITLEMLEEITKKYF